MQLAFGMTFLAGVERRLPNVDTATVALYTRHDLPRPSMLPMTPSVGDHLRIWPRRMTS
jgi:hypothetical protein